VLGLSEGELEQMPQNNGRNRQNLRQNAAELAVAAMGSLSPVLQILVDCPGSGYHIGSFCGGGAGIRPLR
jgi:hypothetical protein